jgi:hypothetical protein
MLTIRATQMAVFEERAFDALAVELIDHVRAELPEFVEDLPDAALRDRLRLCAAVARGYGLSESIAMLAMVDASFLLDDVRFDLDPDYPWARAILGSPHLSEQEKALQLVDCAFAANQLVGED